MKYTNKIKRNIYNNIIYLIFTILISIILPIYLSITFKNNIILSIINVNIFCTGLILIVKIIFDIDYYKNELKNIKNGDVDNGNSI